MSLPRDKIVIIDFTKPCQPCQTPLPILLCGGGEGGWGERGEGSSTGYKGQLRKEWGELGNRGDIGNGDVTLAAKGAT